MLSATTMSRYVVKANIFLPDTGLIRDQILNILLASRDTVRTSDFFDYVSVAYFATDVKPVDLHHIFFGDTPRCC